jgi:mono/diheme cytochrome c family protein
LLLICKVMQMIRELFFSDWAPSRRNALEGQMDLRITGWMIILAGAAATLSTGLTACHSTSTLTPQEAEGKHLYQVRCAHCHEDNDLALTKVPPDLHHVFAHQTLPSGAPATDAEVQHVVLAGKGMMPAFTGRFTDEQMAALLAYLHTGLL